MNKIDNYLNTILKKLDLSYKEKKELKLQFKDHILNLEESYLSEGYSPSEASNLAIKAFNNDEFIIEHFNNNSTKLFYICRILAAVSIIPIGIMFGIVFNFVRLLAFRIDLYALIPLNFTVPLIQNIIDKGIYHLHPVYDYRLFLTFLCIPIGFLIPIIINRLNSFIPSLKVFNIIFILLEIIDYHRNIDFILFSNLAFLLGYFLLKILIKFNKIIFNKKS
ncbi:hypothetical protein [Clostridium saccharoperbutylacetonicum]|uniref:hypothetical protein n=1 Tax=Clostridium saccharoperbutylacetonicum TaxID=36745 RepID=UPI0039ED4071